MPDYAAAIRRAARKHGVNPELLLAQLQAESGLNPNARSPAGAQGIAQFMPGTAKGYGVNLNDGRARDDIDGAARHMRDLLKRYGGDPRKALAAYNAGAGAVDKYGGVPPFAETQAYVKKILGSVGDTSAPSPSSSPARTPKATVDPEARRALLTAYLAQRGKPGALLELASGLKNLKPDAQVEGSTYSEAPLKARGSDNLLELFYRGPGGLNVKHGQVVDRDFVTGHEDHVHVASGPKQTKRLMRLAKDMGLTVTSTTGGKHEPTSYHYAGKAIDVAGDPEKMAAFARRVASLYGIR